jgi:hypothetical protein
MDRGYRAYRIRRRADKPRDHTMGSNALLMTKTNRQGLSGVELHEVRGAARGVRFFDSRRRSSLLTPLGWLVLLAIAAASGVAAVLASAV